MRWLWLLFLPVYCFAQGEYDSLPPNIYLDTLHYPFTYGVNSGDPLADRVIIWTRIEPNKTNLPATVHWEMSTDKSFQTLANSGDYEATAEHDFTVKIDVTNLQAGTTYYYRFNDAAGHYSVTGRAKTAPVGELNHYRIAAMSCSSIFSGYFNAYRNLGQREDIDLVVHLGDYIYDYVDRDEQIRVPHPYPKEPTNLEEYRNQHKYYLADPDLRLARQNHSWIVVWDNHDIETDDPEIDRQAKQAFFEYVPVRVTDPNDPQKIYRSFQFGNLFQLSMTDMDTYEVEKSEDSVNATFLGKAQFEWLEQQLADTNVVWKVIGSQKMVSGWYNKKLPKPMRFMGDDTFFDPSSFDGHAEERDSLLRYIGQQHIDNVFAVSGDMHVTFVANLVPDPFVRQHYNKHTGKGAVGVEFMPSSISRGNMDEAGVPPAFARVMERLSLRINPHHVYCEFTSHGYGVLDITPDRIIAELWYFPILKMTDQAIFGGAFKVKRGLNHWEWGRITKPITQ